MTEPGAGIFCTDCGYNLRGIDSERCPECGIYQEGVMDKEVLKRQAQ